LHGIFSHNNPLIFSITCIATASDIVRIDDAFLMREQMTLLE